MTIFPVSMGIFGFVFIECLLSSPLCFICLLSKLLNLFGFQGNKKGIYQKKFKKKKILFRNHKVD